MRNLNLSQNALDFLTALSQESSKPIWTRIKALLPGEKPADIEELGKGVYSAKAGNYQIFLRYDDQTVHVDHIGLPGEGADKQPKQSSKSQGTTTPTTKPAAVPNSIEKRQEAIPPTVAKVPDSAVEFFLLVFTAVLFALSVNRWLSHEFVVLNALKFLPLSACFAGFALGVSRPDDRLFRCSAASFLLTAILCESCDYLAQRNAFQAQAFWQMAGTSDAVSTFLSTAPAMLPVIAAVFVPLAFVASLGSRVGRLFQQHGRFTPYGIFIAAALCAYVVFAAITVACLSPLIQLLLVAAATTFLFFKAAKPQVVQLAVMALALVVLLLPLQQGLPSNTYWSPYHQIKLADGNHGLQADAVLIDNTLSQALSADKGKSPSKFNLSCLRQPAGAVLALNTGVGTGLSDIVRQHVKTLDAVELDPVLIKLGRRLQPDYDAGSVNVICQDPRWFVNNCQNKYDLVLFSPQDFVHWYGAPYIDENKYLRTVESFKKALKLVTENGALVFSFDAPAGPSADALRDSYYATAKAAAGHEPLLLSAPTASGKVSYLFVVASQAAQKYALQTMSPQEFQPITPPTDANAQPITDDYPYLSADRVQSATLYLLVSVLMIALVFFFARRGQFFKDSIDVEWQLFLLGTAFALMIYGSLPRLFTLFGNGWVSSAIIFGGMLVTAWLTNYAIHRPGASKFEIVLYFGLLVSLVISFFLPVQWLMSFGVVGILVVTFFTVLPAFRVLLMQAAAFGESKHLASAIAYNLLGFSAGLLLTALSVGFGQNGLIFVAALIFGGSFVFYTKSRKAYASTSKLATKRIT